MKNKLIATLCYGIFATAFTHSALAATDISANLQISGSVTDSQNEGCHVDFGNVTSVTLDGSTDNLMSEDIFNSAQAHPILIYVQGDSATGECARRIQENKIALKFTGMPDTANGQTLGNTLTDDDAARGIGVEIFQNNKVVPVNSQLPLTNTGSTGNMVIDLQLVKLDGQTPAAGKMQNSLTVEVAQL